MHGRRIIKTCEKEITDDNVLSVLQEAIPAHEQNRSEIEYLWGYYRGKQPVLNRTKKVRPEICNRIVENRANEIVSFKVGYLCGEPIQYVGRNTNAGTTEAIMTLNEYMFAEDKPTQDQEIVEWQMICGTSFRIILPDERGEEDEAPFEMYTLDPRDTFIVYSNEIGNKPLMGVKSSKDNNGICRYSIYTKNKYYLVENDILVASMPHALDTIPIFEYPANNARLGSFEMELPLLDAINNINSNRMDGVEQAIQAFLMFVNCDVESGALDELREKGAISVPSREGLPASISVIKTELDQMQTQTLKDDLYNSVLSICGMPNRNGGSSTSDTGAAVMLRDGWTLAEARAKDSEHMFKKSEKKALKLILRICRELSGLNLKLRDIDLQFTRRNYENIQGKAQVLVSMLQQPKIHPLLAFQHSGMFIDPERAYSVSMEYYDKNQELPVESAQTKDNTSVSENA